MIFNILDYSLPIGLQFRVRYYSNLRRLNRPPFEFRNFSAALLSLDSRSFEPLSQGDREHSSQWRRSTELIEIRRH